MTQSRAFLGITSGASDSEAYAFVAMLDTMYRGFAARRGWDVRILDTEPGDSEPGDSEPGDSEPGDNEPGDNEPGDSEPGDNEPGDGGLRGVWLVHRHLAPIRDAAPLARLSEAERDGLEDFWSEVRQLATSLDPSQSR